MIRRILSMCSRTRVYLPKAISSREDLGICSVGKLYLYLFCLLLISSGNGIINADGDLWKVQRKAGLHFLNNANLKVLTDEALPQYIDENVGNLEKMMEGSIVDLEEIFHELTTQLMGQMAYNVRLPAIRFELQRCWVSC
jgi:hypothetical protein